MTFSGWSADQIRALAEKNVSRSSEPPALRLRSYMLRGRFFIMTELHTARYPSP